MSACSALAAASRSVTSKYRVRAADPACVIAALDSSSAAEGARPCATTVYPARASRTAIARPMPRLDPVTRTLSATRGFREQRCEIARAICLERAFGETLAVGFERAVIRGEILLVAQRKFHGDLDPHPVGKVLDHAAIITRADQEPDRGRRAALHLLDTPKRRRSLGHVFDADPAWNTGWGREPAAGAHGDARPQPVHAIALDRFEQAHCTAMRHEVWHAVADSALQHC